jgi:hypothetical protein
MNAAEESETINLVRERGETENDSRNQRLQNFLLWQAEVVF